MALLSLYPQFEIDLMPNHKVIELLLHLKSAKTPGKNYIKVRPHLVRHSLCNRLLQVFHDYFSKRPGQNPGGGNSTLIRWVCATGVLNLSPCSGVGKPKRIPCSGVTAPSLNLLYCIVLETKIMFMLYLFNQNDSAIPLNFVMFVQKSFKFSITVISLSYDICSAFQD